MTERSRHAAARPEPDSRLQGSSAGHGAVHGRGAGGRRACPFCIESVHHIDYKDVGRIRSHIGEHGKLEPRRRFGTCARHQRSLTVAVKRARYIGLVPVTSGAPRY